MKYKIKIYTKYLQTEFEIQPSKEIHDIKDLHPYIIDFIGQNDISWQKNPLQYTGKSGFYITYEEVTHGSGQHGVVREEAQARV